MPPYHWVSPPGGSAAAYLTQPLASNTTVVGAGRINLWVRSSTPNVDLQATITEVRPDGKKEFVQGGWLRANERKLSTSANNLFKQRSTLFEPIPTELASDVRPMPRNRFVELTIPLYYEGHAFRKGSRIRVWISAPNGDQPIWSFSETTPPHAANVAIAFSKKMPSSLILPVVPGLPVPTGLPPCPGLRGEPCRSYRAFANRNASLAASTRRRTRRRRSPTRRAVRPVGFTG